VAFLDLDTLKTRLRIPLADTSQDVLLNGLVAAVNSELLGLFHLDDCPTQSYTTKYDVLDEVPGLWLRQYPVRSITSVTVDGVLQDAATYYLDERPGTIMGSLRRKAGGASAAFDYWPVGPQIVEVVHTAGWTGGTVDAELTAAAVSIATWLYNTEPKTGLESERIGQYAYKLASGAAGIGYGGANAGGFPAGAARVLAQWLRPFAQWS
jgi:hypothetical protein